MIAEPGKSVLHVVILPTTTQQADEVVPTLPAEMFGGVIFGLKPG